MGCLRLHSAWLAILACLLGSGRSQAASDAFASAPQQFSFSTLPDLSTLPEEYRERLSVVLRKPSLHIRGPVETFRCNPEVYHWLLDHPDRAVKGWLRLGARCAPISDRGNGRFGCKDDQGNDVWWETVLHESHQRIWYAEGVVRPGLLLPAIPVRAIIVVHIVLGHDAKGRVALRHQGELILHTNNKAAALATRLFGVSAPRMAEQYVGQIQTFFAALAWMVNEHPERMKELLAE
jgi:hypothetical protein